MRTLALLVIVALLTTGCVSYGASRGVVIVGGALIVGGVIAGATSEHDGQQRDHPDINGNDIAAVLLVGSGLVFVISGLIGMAAFGRPKPPQQNAAPQWSAPPNY